MKRIGIIVAMKSEFEALYDKIGEKQESIRVGSREIYHYVNGKLDLYVTDTAEGEIAATMMTQYLITKFGVEMILNFGLCGSLKPEYKCKDLVLVKEVVHFDFDITALNPEMKVGEYPDRESIYFTTDETLRKEVLKLENIKEVRVASSDKFIGEESKKQGLIRDFDADVCEMESAGIVITSEANEVPCLLVKCISDNAGDDAKYEFRDIVKSGVKEYVDLIIKLLKTLQN